MNLCDQLIEELDAARERMQTLISHLPADAEVYPGWTKKQLLAHITGWDDLVITTLNRHLEGLAPHIAVNRGIDYYNETTVTEREALPLEHIEREYITTRQNLKTLLCSLPPERLNEVIILPWGPRAQISEFIRIFSNHEIEHEEEIKKKLGILDE